MTNEAYEQIKLFNWVAYARNTYPQLDLLYHVPNGGKRNQKEAFNLKRQGVRAGVPDLCLPVSRGNITHFTLNSRWATTKRLKSSGNGLRD